MNICPRCGKWSYEFDNYFGRFRCYNSECSVQMIESSEERTINLLNSFSTPKEIYSQNIKELSIKTLYDNVNNVLIFDFGLNGFMFDLPDPNDYRIIWKIIPQTSSISGFIVLASKINEDEIERIGRRKKYIEMILRSSPELVSLGRASQLLVESIRNENILESEIINENELEFISAIKKGLQKFHNMTIEKTRN